MCKICTKLKIKNEAKARMKARQMGTTQKQNSLTNLYLLGEFAQRKQSRFVTDNFLINKHILL